MQARPERPASDIHFRNARVIDGTGEKPFRGDVIVRDNPIAPYVPRACAGAVRTTIAPSSPRPDGLAGCNEQVDHRTLVAEKDRRPPPGNYGFTVSRA